MSAPVVPDTSVADAAAALAAKEEADLANAAAALAAQRAADHKNATASERLFAVPLTTIRSALEKAKGKSAAKRLEAVCTALKLADAPCSKNDAKSYLAVNNVDI